MRPDAFDPSLSCPLTDDDMLDYVASDTAEELTLNNDASGDRNMLAAGSFDESNESSSSSRSETAKAKPTDTSKGEPARRGDSTLSAQGRRRCTVTA